MGEQAKSTEAKAKYQKNEILKSKRYETKRDFIVALLKEGQEYTLKEVDLMIERYEKGKVV